jgi:hypothetical protein
VTYDPTSHRRNTEAWLLKLVREGGRGWHDYSRHKARQLAAEIPALFADLPAAVEAAINETAPKRATTTNRRA